MDNAYELQLSSSYNNDDERKPVVLSADYGTNNSSPGHFSFDLKANPDALITGGIFTDVPRDDLVDFAKWVLDQAGEAHQTIITQEFEELETAGDGDIIYVYNGTVNNYYGGQYE